MQETYARWYVMSRQQREAIESPGAWLPLIALLDPDATAIADGGGLATTFLRPIEGGDRIGHIWVVRNPGKLRPWATG